MRAMVACCLLVVGCLAGPKEVAQRYWEAWQTGRTEVAKDLTVRGHVQSALPVKVTILHVTTSEANVTDGLAQVPTRIGFEVVRDGVRTPECNATIRTELLRIDGQWRIDGLVTMRHFDEGVQKALEACALRMLRQTMRKSEKVLSELLERLMGSGQEFETLFRRWQEQMQKALRQLEKEPPGKTGPRLPPPESGEKI